MSRWLKALALVAPNATLSRVRALAALRYYDAAQISARTNTLRSRPGSANLALSGTIEKLQSDAHNLVRNTPEAARTIEVLSSHIVGTGIKVSWQTGYANRDRLVKDLWQRWCRLADMEGVLDFAGIKKLAVSAMFEGGDTLVRLIGNGAVRGDERARGLPPLRLQLLEGDQLDRSHDRIFSEPNGNRICFGVEVDDWNRRQAYHVQANADGDHLPLNYLPIRLPASDVCHLFRPLRPGQLRGVTIFAPVMLTARDHADLIEALTIKARMEACFGIGVESPDAGKMSLAPQAPGEGSQEGKLAAEDMNPGMVLYTRPGEKLVTISPTGGLAAEPILLANLMRFASGVNLTYDQVTGDLRQANYSSLRAGKIEFFRFVEQFQWLNLVPQLLDRVTERWLDQAFMLGLLPGRQQDYRYSYVMPAREPIDPKKDLEADILAVRSGRMSPQEFIEAWGHDWRDVVDDLAKFLAEIDRRGIVMDIDPRRTSQLGVAQNQASQTGDQAS